MTLRKIIILIILILVITSGYYFHRLSVDRICLAIYSPVSAKNIFTGELRIFSNACEVPYWWNIKKDL